MKQDFDATLSIHVNRDADTPETALAEAIAAKDYTVNSARVNTSEPPRYISTAEYAKRHGYASNIYVSKQCAAGLIPGVIKLGHSYGIPEDTPKIDRRYTAGGKHTDWYAKYGRKRYEKQKAAKAEQKPTNEEP